MRPASEEPVAIEIVAGDVRLSVFEWEGESPPLLFAHATGFHARCWDEVIRRLPGRHAYAIDLRGHGRSGKPSLPYDWWRFGDDAAAVARALDVRGAIGVGHSMGGHSLVYAADREPDRFAALLLVDPVIRARAAYATDEGRRGGVPDSSFIARRRDEWSSPAEMIERLGEREPFSRWARRVLEDYCHFGLLPAPDGAGYVLACPPAIEAEIYGHSMSTDVGEAIARLSIPVRVLRAPPPVDEAARRAFAASPTAPDLASRFARGEDVLLADATHFIPMESPDVVASHIEELIELVQLAR